MLSKLSVLVVFGFLLIAPAMALNYEDCLPALEAVTVAREARAGPNEALKRAQDEAWASFGAGASAELQRILAEGKARHDRIRAEANANYKKALRENYAAYNRAKTLAERTALKREAAELGSVHHRALARAMSVYGKLERTARGEAERRARLDYDQAIELANRAYDEATAGVSETLVKALAEAWPGPEDEHSADMRRRLEAVVVECEVRFRSRHRK